MAVDQGYLDHLRELLEPLGRIAFRRMFGGAGIYCDGQFIALVIDDVLYLRTDDASQAAYQTEGMAPFTYETREGAKSLRNYWRAPERLLDDADEMRVWAARAVKAAAAAAAAKPAKRKPGPGAKSGAGVKRKPPAARG